MSQKLIWIIGLVLLVCSISASAGTISGFVKDQNGEALIGATVVVEESKTAAGGYTLGRMTDKSGAFKFDNIDTKKTIKASYIGYETQSRGMSPGESFTFKLKETVTQLPELLVTADKIEDPESYVISGFVTGDGRNKLKGVTIEFIPEGKMSQRAVTDGDGFYAIYDKVFRTPSSPSDIVGYLSVSHPGYEWYRQDITVNLGTPKGVNINLKSNVQAPVADVKGYTVDDDFDYVVIDYKDFSDSVPVVPNVFKVEGRDASIVSRGSSDSIPYAILPQSGWYANPVIRVKPAAKIDLWKKGVDKSKKQLNLAVDYTKIVEGNSESGCSYTVIKGSKGSIPFYVCFEKKQADATGTKKDIKDTTRAFVGKGEEGSVVDTDAGNWVCADSATVAPNIEAPEDKWLEEDTEDAEDAGYDEELVDVEGSWCRDTEPVENSYCVENVCCDASEPTLLKRAGKVVASAVGKKPREFCWFAEFTLAFARLTINNNEIFNEARAVSETNKVDPLLTLAVITLESRGDRYSKKGLMQIDPIVAKKYQGPPDNLNYRQWKDNVKIGVLDLKEHLDAFGSVEVALAANNLGPSRMQRWSQCLAGKSLSLKAVLTATDKPSAAVTGCGIKPRTLQRARSYVAKCLKFMDMWEEKIAETEGLGGEQAGLSDADSKSIAQSALCGEEDEDISGIEGDSYVESALDVPQGAYERLSGGIIELDEILAAIEKGRPAVASINLDLAELKKLTTEGIASSLIELAKKKCPGCTPEQLRQMAKDYLAAAQKEDTPGIDYEGVTKKIDEAVIESGATGDSDSHEDGCKDDFILIEGGKEIDCWAKESLCVKEKNQCVKFDGMGWNAKTTEIVYSFKRAKDYDDMKNAMDSLYIGVMADSHPTDSLIPVFVKGLAYDGWTGTVAAGALPYFSNSPKVKSISPYLIELFEKPFDAPAKWNIQGRVLNLLRSIDIEKGYELAKKTLNSDANINVKSVAMSLIAHYKYKSQEAYDLFVKVLKGDPDPFARADAALNLRDFYADKPELFPILVASLESENDLRAKLFMMYTLEDLDPKILDNYIISERVVPHLAKFLSRYAQDTPERKDFFNTLTELVVNPYFDSDKRKTGMNLANLINLLSSDNPDPWVYQKLAVLMNQLHDTENTPQDVFRTTFVQNLDLKSVYYLIGLGGSDLYTSSFEKLYYYNMVQGQKYPAPKYPDFLQRIKSSIDPRQDYTLPFILTLANYNKLKGVIAYDPEFIIGTIKKALLEGDTYKLRDNGMLLVSTIQAIFEDQGMSKFKPEMEEFLISQYYLNRPQKTQEDKSIFQKAWDYLFGPGKTAVPEVNPMNRAVVGYNIKLNKDKFSAKNKQMAAEISNELPEVIEPVVPKEWLNDGTLTAKLYFTQEGQIDRTRDQSLIKFFEFRIEQQTDKATFMTVRPDSVLSDGRSGGSYNGVKLRVILTEELGDVQQSVNDPMIDIVSHRGHSFSELEVFSPTVKSNKVKLVFLGGCGGYRRVGTIQNTLPNAYFVSDENIAQGDTNDRVLFYIMRSIAKRNRQSKILWSEVEQDVRDGYASIQTEFNEGIIFPHNRGLLLNAFIQQVTSGTFVAAGGSMGGSTGYAVFDKITGKATGEDLSCKTPRNDESYKKYSSSIIVSMGKSGFAITFESLEGVLQEIGTGVYGKWDVKKLRGALYSQMRMDLQQLIKWMSQNMMNNGQVIFIKEKVIDGVEEGSLYSTNYRYKFYPGSNGLTIYDNKGNGLFSVILTNEKFWSYYDKIKDNANWGPAVDKWNDGYKLPEDKEFSLVYYTGWPVDKNGNQKYMGLYLNKRKMALFSEAFRRGDGEKLKSIITGTWDKFANWFSDLATVEKGSLARSITHSLRFITSRG